MVEVSVVMPLYNTRRYIEEALTSIMQQEGVDFEMIVIDDASTDGSSDIVAAMAQSDNRIRHIKLEKNGGMAAGMNRGIAEARAPLIAQMDSDDVALPGRLKTQYDYMLQHPEIDCLGSSVFHIDSEGKRLNDKATPQLSDPTLISWAMLFSNVLVNPTMMSRTECLRANPYSLEKLFHYCVDYELWCRMNWKRKFANLTVPLLKYRFHEQQGSQQYLIVQNEAALECSRRCAEELIAAPVSPKEMARLRETSNLRRAIDLEEFKSTTALMTKVLASFMKRKMLTDKNLTNVGSVVSNYITRVQLLAHATGSAPQEIEAMLTQQKDIAQKAIMELLPAA